jgi:formate dehydrogenase subunit delta
MSDEHNSHTHQEQAAVKLAKMAGQIESFFAHYPEEKAIASIAEHINKFWSKKMRQDFMVAYEKNQSALTHLVGKALPQIRH